MNQKLHSHPSNNTNLGLYAAGQQPVYANPKHLQKVCRELSQKPAMVSHQEIEKLRQAFSEAEKGERFLIQAGDCAEVFSDCRFSLIQRKRLHLEWIAQLCSLKLQRPVTLIGRIAGQYAKPRSHPYESYQGISIPSYRGDMVNSSHKSLTARTPDPERLLKAYQCSMETIHHLRAVEQKASKKEILLNDSSKSYLKRWQEYAELHSIQALNPHTIWQSPLYTSHECLHLAYESCFTRRHPSGRQFNFSAHTVWLGERTRELGGAHVEYFRGIHNPIGVKISAASNPSEIVNLIKILNPERESGRLALIIRMGANKITSSLRPLAQAVQHTGIPVCWLSDPMHGNTQTTPGGLKTRLTKDIQYEAHQCRQILAEVGIKLAGIHLETSSEAITECMSTENTSTNEACLHSSYTSLCDPRLSDLQTIELMKQLYTSSRTQQLH